MIIGIPKESFPGERRVAIIPANIAQLAKFSARILVERGAGERAGFADTEYSAKGATLCSARAELFAEAQIVLQVRGYGSNFVEGAKDLGHFREDHLLIALCDPLGNPAAAIHLAERKVAVFAMELIPRTTKAQSMDALSAMATIAGYKGMLCAAEMLPRMFPLLMTAAGTVSPARVFVIGAGVAGLQAIATARRLGALVRAYDVRPAVKEQVKSLGADFIELPLDTAAAEEGSGYAAEQSEEFYRRQRDLMREVVSTSDVVITTAAVPGRKAPVLVTEEMVSKMPAGSVIIDLAAESGGNCELTVPGETVTRHGVQISGPINIASSVPYHASQMYSKNLTSFVSYLFKDGELNLNRGDEIIRDTLLTQRGEILHPNIQEHFESERIPLRKGAGA